MVYFFIVFLLLHIFCCVFTFLGIKAKSLLLHDYMFFVVLFVPLWGFVIAMTLHLHLFITEKPTKNISVEKMELDSELYKAMTVGQNRNTDTIIPLEEALVINSPRERRNLIMDVLNDNPKEYIEFLQKAGDNDDTEVVHYAVTAMVEISKENDYMLQKYERMHAANPDDFKLLCEYADFLASCLDQSLMQGQVEIMNRNILNELLGQKIEIKKTVEDYVLLAKNNLKLGNYTRVGEIFSDADRMWPDNEDIILLKLEYYSTIGRGDKLRQVLDTIEEKGVYLSAKAKEALAFWKV